MKFIVSAIFLGLISGQTANSAPTVQCPPPGLQPLSNLNITEYISKRWFVQQQMPIRYLEEDTAFCVTAKYEVRVNDSDGLVEKVLSAFRSNSKEIEIDVFNYANQNGVNGKAQVANLSAVVLDPENKPASLLVGPAFIPRIFWGPYWVVAAGPSADNYQWAIVSGGAPKFPSNNGCKTDDGSNNSGLWLFTRAQVASPALIKQMLNVTQSLGYDTSVLIPVQQKDCKYEGIQTGL